ncbi:hypothetical protein LR65_25440, partial [Escherichia coli]
QIKHSPGNPGRFILYNILPHFSLAFIAAKFRLRILGADHPLRNFRICQTVLRRRLLVRLVFRRTMK